MDKNDLKLRTKVFANNCDQLSVMLPNTFLGNHIKWQLIRCSISVASNYRVTFPGQSKASFISKISIVIEEADEPEFWLEFILDEKLLSENITEPLRKEAHELVSIFITLRRTANGNAN